MRIIALGVLGSVGILAASEVMSPPIWIQGGALALLGGVLYLLLTKVLPGHAKEMKEERDANREDRKSYQKSIDGFSVVLDRFGEKMEGMTKVIERCRHNHED